MFTTILTVVRPLALAYLGAAFLLYLFQGQLIYYPGREVVATPADIDLRFEVVRFAASDGVRLVGWWVPAQAARGTILFCHGNAGNISHRLESIGIFHELRLNVFIFDYRGYGESEGHPSEAGIRLDAEAALGWIEDHQTSEDIPVIFFGRSLGGAVAARLAASHPPAALIIESAFTSVRDLAFEKIPLFPMR
ncbi:alpha/beta hydrolase, partial [Candidatus Latescibacterota bacterium]